MVSTSDQSEPHGLHTDSKDEPTDVNPLLEEDINTLDESLISFRLSGMNEDLSQSGQPFDMPTSDENSAMQSPWMKSS